MYNDVYDMHNYAKISIIMCNLRPKWLNFDIFRPWACHISSERIFYADLNVTQNNLLFPFLRVHKLAYHAEFRLNWLNSDIFRLQAYHISLKRIFHADLNGTHKSHLLSVSMGA